MMESRDIVTGVWMFRCNMKNSRDWSCIYTFDVLTLQRSEKGRFQLRFDKHKHKKFRKAVVPVKSVHI